MMEVENNETDHVDETSTTDVNASDTKSTGSSPHLKKIKLPDGKLTFSSATSIL
jgi:hypothetical protein